MRRRLRRVVAWSMTTLTVVVVVPIVALAITWCSLPDVGRLETAWPTATSYMKRRERRLGLAPQSYRLERTPLDTVPAVLVCALIKAEDSKFLKHHGIDLSATWAATKSFFRGSRRFGGSTITQQLARNLFLGPQRTVGRKLSEWLLARDLEDRFAKREILELYLSSIEWGNGIWGVTSAARAYFKKAPAELDAFEAVFLVSVIPSPRSMHTRRNQRRALWSQTRLLTILSNQAVITRHAGADGINRANHVAGKLSAGSSLAEALEPTMAAEPLGNKWPSADNPCARNYSPAR